ncbi:MAG: HEAT repeat domain-containing protein [Planctomycetota bacterium]
MFALLGACAPEPASIAPRFELVDVVTPMVAALEAALPPEQPAPEPAGDTRELVLGALATISSRDARMRAAATEDVRAQGDTAVSVLALAIADATLSREERAAAIDALASVGTRRAAEALTIALEKGSEPWIRARSAWRLADVRHDGVLLRLLLRLRYEVDAETVIWLAATVARHGNYSGLDGLRTLRTSAATEELRASAAQQLDELAKLAGAADPERLHEEWLSGALDARVQKDAPSPELELAVWRAIAGLAAWDLRGVDDRRFQLSRMNTWVVPLLARTLHDSNVYVRVHAAQCLERMGTRGASAGPELVAALGEPRVAASAAAALAAVRWLDAVPALETALATSQDLELRTAIARALGSLGQARSASVLVQAFAESEPIDLRQAAAEALVAVRDDEVAVRFLHECLTSGKADAGAAENVLGAWLKRRAASLDPTLADASTRWSALDPAPDTIATSEQALQRQRARSDILSEVLAAKAR